MASTEFDMPLDNDLNALGTNLGSPSSASSVTGADAFSKINTLNGNIITVDNKVTTQYYTSLDLNNVVETGTYWVQGSATHAMGNYFALFVIAIPNRTGNSQRVRQVIFTENSNQIYTRYLYAGTWSDWKQISVAS